VDATIATACVMDRPLSIAEELGSKREVDGADVMEELETKLARGGDRLGAVKFPVGVATTQASELE
jgi:hypothetical protein